MTDHLPECGVRKPCGVCGNITYAVCICDRLRACQVRVWKDADRVVNEMYRTALDEAREVVQTHRISGYRCSCGAEVNSTHGHLSSVIDTLVGTPDVTDFDKDQRNDSRDDGGA